jgi:hypothetical protein
MDQSFRKIEGQVKLLIWMAGCNIAVFPAEAGIHVAIAALAEKWIPAEVYPSGRPKAGPGGRDDIQGPLA